MKVVDGHGQPAGPQERADYVIDKLNQLIARFDDEFAAMVVNEAVPDFQKFYQNCQSQPYTRLPDDSLLGRGGVAKLALLADRIAGLPDGDAAIAGFATMKAWNSEAILTAINAGVGSAYTAAYGDFVKTKTGWSSFVHDSLAAASRVQLDHLRKTAAEHSDALAEHGAQMARIANDLSLFPADRYEKAMNAYRNSMGADWQRRYEGLNREIIEDGKLLLRHMIVLNKIAQETGLAEAVRTENELIANDPKASLAIQAALESDPNLIQSKNLTEITGLIAAYRKEPGSTGKLAFLALRMTNVAATAFLRKTVFEKFSSLEPGDPAATMKITRAFDGLRNEWFSDILGLNIAQADRDRLVEIMTKASIKYADNVVRLETGVVAAAEIDKLNAAITNEFNDEIDKFAARVVAFGKNTLAGQVVRTAVASVAIGLNFMTSLNATLDKPDAVKIARTVDLGLLGLQRASDLLVSVGVNPKSAVGRYAALKLGEVPGIGRVMGSELAAVPIGEVYLQIYSILEAANAVRSAFGWGVPQDTVQAGLSAVSAVGFGLTFARAYGAAEWTGPIGIVIAAATARGQMIYDGSKNAHQDETKIQICLKAAGVKNDEIAKTVAQQMPYRSFYPGQSQLPLLSRYANYRKLDVVDWINGFTPDQIERLSDLVLNKLNNGAENPSQYRRQPVPPDVIEEDAVDVMKAFEREMISSQLISYQPLPQQHD